LVAARSTALLNLDHTILRAPINGIVTNLTLVVGQYASVVATETARKLAVLEDKTGWSRPSLRASPKCLWPWAEWHDSPARGLAMTAMSNVDARSSAGFIARGRRVSERPAGCGAGAVGDNDPANAARWVTAQDRHASGMNPIPYLLCTGCPGATCRASAAMLESQSIKSPEKGRQSRRSGLRAGKHMKAARSTHAVVDSERMPMRVVAYSAAIQDRDGAYSR
jgi:hypothetical protein